MSDAFDVRDGLTDSLERLEAGDRDVHAFVSEPLRRVRVLRDAEMISKRFDGAGSPDLLGVLVGVKDTINADGIPTRAGSDLPSSLFEGPEATIVRRLRDAGALIAGKTTTTEFAFSEPAGTRNPRNLEHTPGGSSSGSAAAVAADLVPVALGTQTVDSIITPAAYCGVVGFKPTHQRMPLDGVIPFSPSMDSGGLFTTDLSAARIVASVVCDSWRDTTLASEPVLGIPAAEYVQKAGVQAYDGFEAAIGYLRTNGFATVETSALSDIEAIAATHRRLIAAEFARVHADWYSQYSDRYRPRTASLFAEGAALGYTAIIEGQHSADELRRTLEDIMEIEGITAWASPSATGVAPVGLDYIGDPIMGLPWTHAHLPVVSLPIPHLGRLPLGIQFTGRTGQDEELLDLAQRVEQAMQQDLRVKPRRP